MKFSTTNAALRKVLAQLKPITDNAISMPLLMSAHFEVRDKVVTVTATDRYRVVFARLETEGSLEEGSVAIDLVALQRALRVVTIQHHRHDDVVVITASEGIVKVAFTGSVTVFLPATEGDYPNVWNLVAKATPKEGSETHWVNPEYARDLFPQSAHGEIQAVSSVGGSGFLVAAGRDVFSILVPLRGTKSAPFEMPEFMKSRTTGKS